jgi:hypothetical protein
VYGKAKNKLLKTNQNVEKIIEFIVLCVKLFHEKKRLPKNETVFSSNE